MAGPKKVSVVIPCFNHGEFLRDAVQSVTKLDRSDVELIVVDDGSTDERTRIEMAALEREGQHVIRQENKGLAAARNAGILASRGEYVLPLDADNRVRSGYFEYGVRILDANSEIGIVYGDAEYIGTRSGRWRLGAFDIDRLLDCNFIDACAIYRRVIWQQNGGYDGTMPVQGLEDWDFWMGAFERGWRFEYVREVLFDYRVADGSMITRTFGHEKPIREFVTRKHPLLYYERHSQLFRNRLSISSTSQALRSLIRLRVRHKLGLSNGTAFPWD